MERTEQYLGSYALLWEDKPKPQVVEEIASWSLETKRIPDPYHFVIREDGKLVSPQTGELVEDSIEKESEIGQREWQAFNKIQEWNKGKDEGLSFWISPPHPERSIFTKIIVSEIQTFGNERHLFNRVLMFDLESNEALEMATDISSYSESHLNVQNAEELRSHPVFVNEGDTNWVGLLNIKIADKNILEKIVNGEDIEQKQLALHDAGIIYDTLFSHKKIGYDDFNVKAAMEEANNMKFFGQFDGTCPPSLQPAFQVMAENSLGVKKLDCNCGFCKQKVTALIYGGKIHCPACNQSAPYSC